MAGGTVPVPTPETEPFWAGTLAGELRVQRCGSCGRHYFYPRPFCRYCQSADVTWQPVSGGGRLVSYVIKPDSDRGERRRLAQGAGLWAILSVARAIRRAALRPRSLEA